MITKKRTQDTKKRSFHYTYDILKDYPKVIFITNRKTNLFGIKIKWNKYTNFMKKQYGFILFLTKKTRIFISF